jgi:glycosyltransferase involved in cell wall biosynthesis
MNTGKNLAGVTIIICCFNSSKRLPQTLKHLVQQKVPENIPWQVVVVDNASTDNTEEIALAYKLDFCEKKIDYSIVKQSKAGLSAARHKGLEVAKYDYLLFCDDDNWLQEDYVYTAYTIMKQDPEVAVLGGRSTGAFEENPPEWFIRFEKAYAIGKQFETSGDITQCGALWGAGCIYRKQALEYLFANDFTQLLSDRIGNKVISGGDHELCIALRLAGYKLYYDERLVFTHYMISSRLNWEWYLNFIKNGSISSMFFDPYRRAESEETSFLKETALYAVYVSIRILIKIKPPLLYFFKKPSPESDEKWFRVWHEKYRILGLCKYGARYRKNIYTIKNAQWISKKNA